MDAICALRPAAATTGAVTTGVGLARAGGLAGLADELADEPAETLAAMAARAAAVATCLRGGFPPVLLRAVCDVLAMVGSRG